MTDINSSGRIRRAVLMDYLSVKCNPKDHLCRHFINYILVACVIMQTPVKLGSWQRIRFLSNYREHASCLASVPFQPQLEVRIRRPRGCI
jgi:hypothetical protein